MAVRFSRTIALDVQRVSDYKVLVSVPVSLILLDTSVSYSVPTHLVTYFGTMDLLQSPDCFPERHRAIVNLEVVLPLIL